MAAWLSCRLGNPVQVAVAGGKDPVSGRAARPCGGVPACRARAGVAPSVWPRPSRGCGWRSPARLWRCTPCTEPAGRWADNRCRTTGRQPCDPAGRTVRIRPRTTGACRRVLRFRPPVRGRAMTGCCPTVVPAGFGVACAACAFVSFCKSRPVLSGDIDFITYCSATVYDYFKKMRARVARQTHRDARHASCSVGRGIVPCGKRRGAGEVVMLAHGGRRGSSTYKTTRTQAVRRSVRGVLQEPRVSALWCHCSSMSVPLT